MRLPLGSRANASTIVSISANERDPINFSMMSNEEEAACIGRTNRSANGAVSGLKRRPTRRTRGATCLSVSSHLVPIENAKLVKPVRCPPGCARFATSPSPTGSVTCTNTTGKSACWSLRATVTGVLEASTTSGAMPTSSAAWLRNTLASSAQRYSICRLRPLIHPACCSPSSKAATRDFASGSLAPKPMSTPIRRMRDCARAPRGQVAAAPSREMNSRRLKRSTLEARRKASRVYGCNNSLPKTILLSSISCARLASVSGRRAWMRG